MPRQFRSLRSCCLKNHSVASLQEPRLPHSQLLSSPLAYRSLTIFILPTLRVCAAKTLLVGLGSFAPADLLFECVQEAQSFGVTVLLLIQPPNEARLNGNNYFLVAIFCSQCFTNWYFIYIQCIVP